MVGVGGCVEPGGVFHRVAQLPAVARHLVAEELVGEGPVVGAVPLEVLEVAVEDAAGARVHRHPVHRVKSRRVRQREALSVAVKLKRQLQHKKVKDLRQI